MEGGKSSFYAQPKLIIEKYIVERFFLLSMFGTYGIIWVSHDI
jgi:hypothetical protein